MEQVNQNQQEELILKARKELLSAIKSRDINPEHLSDLVDQACALLAHLKEKTCSFFEPFKDAIGDNEPSQKPKSHWNERYFDEYCFRTEKNFSYERISHLIEIRLDFLKRRIKGFTLPKQSQQTKNQQEDIDMNNFTPSKNLQDFVSQGDLPNIRIALSMDFYDTRLTRNYLSLAPTWVKNHIGGQNLFDRFETGMFAQAFDTDSNTWDATYFDVQFNYLNDNFSEERFLHLIEVREHLRLKGEEGFKPVASEQTKEHKKSTGNAGNAGNAIKIAIAVGACALVFIVTILTLVRN